MTVRWLDQLGARADLQEVGGKAASLGALCAAGFDVPPGFCITADAYRAAAGASLTTAARDEVGRAFTQLQARADEIGAGTPRFAVRSSATAEDLAEASFAGLYRTILGVTDEDSLFAGIAECWDSTRSPEATQYLQRAGLDRPADMAVIVQLLVPADVAGVLFTAHPVTAELDRAVVNSSWGLGESVVGSLVDCDTWTLAKEPYAVVDERIGDKQTEIPGDGDRAGSVAVDGARRAAPSLRREQLMSLASLASRLEQHFHAPQDAEWAFVGNRLFVLQSRPVTTLHAAHLTEQLHRWAVERGLDRNADAVWVRGTGLSSLPLSPLYFSEMAPFFQDLFDRLLRMSGRAPVTEQLFAFHEGWSYRIADLQRIRPGVPERWRDARWSPRLRVQLRHPRTLSVPRAAAHYYRQRDEVWLPDLAARTPDFDRARPDELWRFIEYVERMRLERSVVAATAVDHAAVLLWLLERMLVAWADTDGSELSDLTSGSAGSHTHDENVALFELVRQARADEEVAALVAAREYDRLEDFQRGRDLLAAVDRFRAERPHRGAANRDLMQPRWGDDRQALLDHLHVFVGAGSVEDPQQAHARAVRRRDEATATAEHRIRSRSHLGFLRVRAFRRLLALTQTYWIHRDNQRHSFDRYFYASRQAYRALGRHLVSIGALDDADDVFFLGRAELRDALDGGLPTPVVHQRASWRRDWWRAKAEVDAPEMLRHGVGWEPTEGLVSDTSADLVGVGGSAGTVVAPARVARDVGGLADLRPGEVLVTQAIDPSWTPVFSTIGAVVSEEGGMLSHATVLAREYGIPAVIGLANATRRITTGQVVRVDGRTGHVTFVDDSHEETPRASA